MATSSLGFENFFSTTLNGAISDTDLTINLNAVPTPSEGFLVIEPDNASKREVVYYTSKGASSVTCPSGAGNGRGYDGTTATSHTDGASVIMAPVAAMFEALQDLSAVADGQVSTAKIADNAVTGAKLEDTGWISTGLSYNAEFDASQEIEYRKVGNIVFVRGSITKDTGDIDSDDNFVVLPVGYRPETTQYFLAVGVGTNHCKISVDSDGTIHARSSTSAATSYLRLDLCFVAG